MINLNEWPLKGEEHPSYDQNSGEYIIALTWKQYELAAKAVRAMAQEEKKLPDQEGWWWEWYPGIQKWQAQDVKRHHATGLMVYYSESIRENWEYVIKGRWVKINEPEGGK